MRDDRWHAAVMPYGFVQRQTHIVIGRQVGDGRIEYVLPQGGTFFTEEAATPGPEEYPAIVVPNAAVPALAEALLKHAGDAIPSAGEIKVLREWLETERARVDRTLGSLGL